MAAGCIAADSAVGYLDIAAVAVGIRLAVAADLVVGFAAAEPRRCERTQCEH